MTFYELSELYEWYDSFYTILGFIFLLFIFILILEGIAFKVQKAFPLSELINPTNPMMPVAWINLLTIIWLFLTMLNLFYPDKVLFLFFGVNTLQQLTPQGRQIFFGLNYLTIYLASISFISTVVVHSIANVRLKNFISKT